MTTALPTIPSAAQSWYADRYQAIFVSRNRWLVTAIAALGLATAQAAALVCLIPLKTSVPFVIKEELSGAITTVAPLSGDASITRQESVRKYFLARYVIARETYDAADLEDNYKTVNWMSAPDVAGEYNQSISQTNRQSPAAVHGQRTTRAIRIKSISFLNESIAQVRLTATEKNISGQERSSEWIALAAFRFGPAPVLESERLINPLGFQVTHYRMDQEVLP